MRQNAICRLTYQLHVFMPNTKNRKKYCLLWVNWEWAQKRMGDKDLVVFTEGRACD